MSQIEWIYEFFMININNNNNNNMIEFVRCTTFFLVRCLYLQLFPFYIYPHTTGRVTLWLSDKLLWLGITSPLLMLSILWILNIFVCFDLISKVYQPIYASIYLTILMINRCAHIYKYKLVRIFFIYLFIYYFDSKIY